MKEIKPYGSWSSPITTDLIVSQSIGLSESFVSGTDIYWLESRPQEKGRSVLVKRNKHGLTQDLIPSPYNCRTRVHEYGGGSFTASGSNAFFTNFSDQRLYYCSEGAAPRALTPPVAIRFADFCFDSRRNCLFSVREDHRHAGEAQNALVRVSTQNENEGILIEKGQDFYSNPRISKAGDKIAWLSWNHPRMPWDGNELWVADLDKEGNTKNARKIAGGPEESVCQPEWHESGDLYFVSDRTGWWNLYQHSNGESLPLFPKTAEFAHPQWVFRQSQYCFVGEDQLVASYSDKGRSRLVVLDLTQGSHREIHTNFSSFDYLSSLEDGFVCVAGSTALPTCVVRINLKGEAEVLKASHQLKVDEVYFSKPNAIEFKTSGGKTAHALYYPPTHPNFTGPQDEKPPLIVQSHGGPTSHAVSTLSLKIQFWTSRGFAVVDVDYGGSSGYGREYRNRLRGTWGIVDVEDCENAARYLIEQGHVDANRVAIKGGSAGGYTTLKALTSSKLFRAGASYYGVSDLEALAKDTHKFESRYLDGLIGAYPEQKELYIERSPMSHIDRLGCPVIFFQGLEDKIVPPNQAERMVEALKRKGIPVAYVPFEGEQHGFRQSTNIQAALESELYFYSKVFGFTAADPLKEVPIL